MPDPASHHPAMFTVKGTTLPRLWWLKPWSTARTLAVTVEALKAYADRADLALNQSQLETIDEKRKYKLLRELHIKGNGYGLHKENERLKRVICEMEERSRG